MRKIVSTLLAALTATATALALQGCVFTVPTIAFEAGIYETYEIEDVPYIKARLIIQPISAEEYEQANGINVVKNASKSEENNVYYSIELYFFDEVTDTYEKSEIINLIQDKSAHQNVYAGKIDGYFGKLQKTEFLFDYIGGFPQMNFCHDSVDLQSLWFQLVSKN